MERLAGRVILLWGWPRRLVALFAGAFATLALAPFDFPAACFLAFPALVWLLEGGPGFGGWLGRLLPAFSAGWWFGFGYFLAGTWWIGADLVGGHPWAAPVAAIGIAAFLALFHGLATLVARLLWSDGIGGIAALAFGFGAAEWLRASLLSGVAWNAVGYTAMPVPLLMQADRIVGLHGMTALAVFVFSAPALIGTRVHVRTGLALAAFLAAAQAGYGYFSLAADSEAPQSLAARIVQPGQDGRADFQGTFESYLALSDSPATEGRPSPQLILWPELSVPFVLAGRPDLLDAVAGVAGNGRTLVVGTIRNEDTAAGNRLYNSVVAIRGEAGIVAAADQVIRLPFAEPIGRLARAVGLAHLLPEKAFFARGARQFIPVSQGVEALPLIGIEAAVPEIAVSQGKAGIILNPALPAGPLAAHQHLRQAQLRAVEAGLPLLLAAPDGISATIDSRGRILDALAVGASGVLDVSVPPGGGQLIGDRNILLPKLTFFAIFGVLAAVLIIRVGIVSARD